MPIWYRVGTHPNRGAYEVVERQRARDHSLERSLPRDRERDITAYECELRGRVTDKAGTEGRSGYGDTHEEVCKHLGITSA